MPRARSLTPVTTERKRKAKKKEKTASEWQISHSDTSPQKLPAGVSEDSVHSESKSGEKTHTQTCQFARLTSDPLKKRINDQAAD